MSEQPAPTPQAVLIATAEDYRRRTGLSHEEWAEAVDWQYCARVAPKHRSLPAPDLNQVTGADDFTKLRRAWDQQIRRYVAGERVFPLELAEAWIEALGEPWRTQCKREVAWRIGCWGAMRHEATGTGDHRSWGETMQDFGDLTQRMGRILADGSINAADAPDIPELRRQIRAMHADLESLERQAARALGEADPGPSVRVVS